jgi:hypothetical protein
MASGYIAGGALAAIVIAILQGVPRQGLANFNKRVEEWATHHNSFFNSGPNDLLSADLLSMIPFLILMILLYLVGREVILRSNNAGKT